MARRWRAAGRVRCGAWPWTLRSERVRRPGAWRRFKGAETSVSAARDSLHFSLTLVRIGSTAAWRLCPTGGPGKGLREKEHVKKNTFHVSVAFKCFPPYVTLFESHNYVVGCFAF